jgi:hypothetical protein
MSCPAIRKGFSEAVDRLIRMVTAEWIQANLRALASASKEKENWRSRVSEALAVIDRTVKRWAEGELLPSQAHQDLLDLYLECLEQQLRGFREESDDGHRGFDEYRPPSAARRAAGLRAALIAAGGAAEVPLIDLMILRFTHRASIEAIQHDPSELGHNTDRICREMVELTSWISTTELSERKDLTMDVLCGILECGCAGGRCSKLSLRRLQSTWSRWGDAWERVTDCILQPEP